MVSRVSQRILANRPAMDLRTLQHKVGASASDVGIAKFQPSQLILLHFSALLLDDVDDDDDDDDDDGHGCHGDHLDGGRERDGLLAALPAVRLPL